MIVVLYKKVDLSASSISLITNKVGMQCIILSVVQLVMVAGIGWVIRPEALE